VDILRVLGSEPESVSGPVFSTTGNFKTPLDLRNSAGDWITRSKIRTSGGDLETPEDNQAPSITRVQHRRRSP
jgi:hypothetical protein